MEQIIIISNIGSTSKKYSVYFNNAEYAWFHFEKIGDEAMLSSKLHSRFEKKKITNETYDTALTFTQKSILESDPGSNISYIAIRTVVPHELFTQDMICDDFVLKTLKNIAHEDPAHITPLISEIQEAQGFLSNDSILLISDSQFHQTRKSKIPLSFERPLHTIGYHGLSCESVIHILDKKNVNYLKLVIAHLGGGSSVTGVLHQKSVFNSMQFSPLGGMIMSSRSGSVDPFLVLKYMNDNKLSYEQTIEHLYTKSGLYALSGVSSDLRIVREQALGGNNQAKQAIMMFVDSIVSTILHATTHTQGIDTLIFTGTIGIRANYIRELVCEKLLWLGCLINYDRNIEIDDECVQISVHNSKIKIYVVQIDEMKQMHTRVQKFLKNKI